MKVTKITRALDFGKVTCPVRKRRGRLVLSKVTLTLGKRWRLMKLLPWKEVLRRMKA